MFAGVAGAHDLAKTSISATFHEDGTYEIDIRTDAQLLLMQLRGADSKPPRNDAQWRAALLENRERLRAAISARFDGARAEPSLRLSIDASAASQTLSGPVATVHLTGHIPRGAATFQWSYGLLYGPYALTLRRTASGPLTTEWLSGPQPSEPFPLGREATAVSQARAIGRYAALGYTHILPGGVDHILFVLGLCLLSRRLRPLLSQVSAFTVAHSVTLGLSMYGVISAPAAIVEPLIAASIALVAIENVFTSDLKPWRIVLVFAFGLLHGLGFAGALAQLGLPHAQFLTALVSFNLGVEAGQLSVVAIAFVAMTVWTKSVSANRRRLVVPVSAVIAATGIYWTVIRVMR